MREITSASLLATVLAVFGCQDRQPRIESTAEWSGWMGDTTIDPAGDLKKLQGKWISTPPRREDAAKWPESYLVIDGDIATYECAADGNDRGRAPRPGEMPRKYRIVINSGVDPKVIRYTHALEAGEPVPMSRTHPEFNSWYKLDGDTLTMWTKWTTVGERAPASFRRVKGEN